MAAEALIVEDAYQKGYGIMRAARKKGMGKGAGVSGEVYGRTAGHRRTGRGQHHRQRRGTQDTGKIRIIRKSVQSTARDTIKSMPQETVQSITECARAGRTQQASWGRLRRWKMQRALARRVILYMMITARRYIPQQGSRQAQAFRLAYR